MTTKLIVMQNTNGFIKSYHLLGLCSLALGVLAPFLVIFALALYFFLAPMPQVKPWFKSPVDQAIPQAIPFAASGYHVDKARFSHSSYEPLEQNFPFDNSPVLPVPPVSSVEHNSTKQAFYYPVLMDKTRLSSSFGRRIHPIGHYVHEHSGVDFALALGEPVFASQKGFVKKAHYSGGYGYLVDIDHGEGFMSRYAHLSSILVKEGDHVNAKQLIALVGSTGNATGAHLHFELRLDNVPIDPVLFLNKQKTYSRVKVLP